MNKDDVSLILLCYQVINVILDDYVEQKTLDRDILMTLTGSKFVLSDLVDILIEQKYANEKGVRPISIEYLMNKIGAVPIKNNN